MHLPDLHRLSNWREVPCNQLPIGRGIGTSVHVGASNHLWIGDAIYSHLANIDRAVTLCPRYGQDQATRRICFLLVHTPKTEWKTGSQITSMPLDVPMHTHLYKYAVHRTGMHKHTTKPLWSTALTLFAEQQVTFVTGKRPRSKKGITLAQAGENAGERRDGVTTPPAQYLDPEHHAVSQHWTPAPVRRDFDANSSFNSMPPRRFNLQHSRPSHKSRHRATLQGP
jgi:hypothetical protein